jgi:hypothetical protein
MKKIMFNDRYGLTQAVLDGRKTMTRRIIKPQPDKIRSIAQDIANYPGYEISDKSICPVPCHHFLMSNNRFVYPAYKVGEIVAVAQNYCAVAKEFPHMATTLTGNDIYGHEPGCSNKIFVRADMMPHQIRITSVRVERLQDISDEDCVKEGILWEEADSEYEDYDFYSYSGMSGDGFETPREAFASLIDKISGRGTWKSNPYVWVYEFELVK